MRELYYAISKKSSYNILIYTSIAEAILKDRAKFINGRLILKNGIGFFPPEKQILTKILLNKRSKFHFPDVFKWLELLTSDCLSQKYYLKIFGFHIKTRKFRQSIKKNLNSGFNKSIVEFIDSEDLNYLSEISEYIEKIILPVYKEKLTVIDRQAKFKEAWDIITLQK